MTSRSTTGVTGLVAAIALAGSGLAQAQMNPTACQQNPQCVLVSQGADGGLSVNRETVRGNAASAPVLFFYWDGDAAGSLAIVLKDPSRSPFQDGAVQVNLRHGDAVRQRVRAVTAREEHRYSVVNLDTGAELDPVIIIDP